MKLCHSSHIGSSSLSQDVPNSDIFNQLGINSRLLDGRLQDGGEQVLGQGIFESSLLIPCEGGSDRGADDDVVCLLSDDSFSCGGHFGLR